MEWLHSQSPRDGEVMLQLPEGLSHASSYPSLLASGGRRGFGGRSEGRRVFGLQQVIPCTTAALLSPTWGQGNGSLFSQPAHLFQLMPVFGRR